jgi:simple sugar transport system ATP-binding protein
MQRVLLARAFAQPLQLLIAHNPTQGLDLPSIEFVYQRLLTEKARGMATLLLSENLDELFLLCNRIAVLYRGAITAMLDRSQFNAYTLGQYMSGARLAAAEEQPHA